MNDLYELLTDLLEADGITEVNVQINIGVTVHKHNTGEVGPKYQEVRKRDISEEEVADIVGDRAGYAGTISLMGDFYVKDKITTNFNAESVEELHEL